MTRERAVGLVSIGVILLGLSALGYLIVSSFWHVQCAGSLTTIGMTRADLLAACGRPEKINVDERTGSKDEQFVYSHDPDDYVYVVNGAVRSMQYPGKP